MAKEKTPRKKRIRRLLWRAILLALLLLAAYFFWIFAHVLWWNYANPSETRFMARRLAIIRQHDPQAILKHQWVNYDQISTPFKRAVVAAEDDRFIEHHGFDWDGISHALEKNLKQGETIAGGSTITQQLAKNLFLSFERNVFRKGKEAMITVIIETVWTKKRILEVYLNVAEWGDGVFGAEAAARHYYGVSAAQIDEAQAARLAVMLPNPRRYEKVFPEYLATHADRVQSRMRYTVLPSEE
ncbi:MAG: monofunctional biosynthetic peptidoglycan transglycosylase [Burkholderiales bacterium]|jgi:monofunctional biosynthetic peptidoglycan transglycosylase|nr:monofunctional biosynthetic peptidoglycan transglycosylase [Burkholderiales bacterium]